MERLDAYERQALTRSDMIGLPLNYAFDNQPFFHQVPSPFHEQMRNDCFGDARLATVEAGEDIVHTSLTQTHELLDGFLGR